jgi:hypothetical protein
LVDWSKVRKTKFQVKKITNKNHKWGWGMCSSVVQCMLISMNKPPEFDSQHYRKKNKQKATLETRSNKKMFRTVGL